MTPEKKKQETAPPRLPLAREDVLKRMEEFAQRKETYLAARGKDAH